MKYQPAKKIIFVFLVLTLVSSVSTITFVTGNNNVDIAFAKKHNSSGSSGGGGGDKSSTDNTNVGTTTGGSDDHNSGGSGSDSGSSGSGNSAGSATSSLSTGNSGNSPASTIDNTSISPQTCPDGSAHASEGSCPSPTTFLTPAVDCNTTPNNPSCNPSSSTTTTPLSPAQQNFAPNTLTQQRCPLLPIDTYGNCQRADMQGNITGESQGQVSHYTLPFSKTHAVQLPDGSCPADYHYYPQRANQGGLQFNCQIDAHFKNPDGSCPAGTLMTTVDTNNVCVKIPVYPGSYTDPRPGGGFIQMFPTRSNTPPATPPTNTTPLPPPSPK